MSRHRDKAVPYVNERASRQCPLCTVPSKRALIMHRGCCTPQVSFSARGCPTTQRPGTASDHIQVQTSQPCSFGPELSSWTQRGFMTAPAPGAFSVTGETGTNKEGKVWSVHMEAVNRDGHGGECKHQEGTLG